MDTKQIYSILKADDAVRATNFLGCFPLDLIPISALRYPCSLVINSKPQDHPGEHWVCVVKTEGNKGIFFDSYGFPPYNMPEVEEVLDECETWTYNETGLQSSFSAVCGQYVIFFLTHIARGYSLDHVIHLLNDLGDKHANDAFIFNYAREMREDKLLL